MKNVDKNYETMNVEGGRHVRMWTRGVPVRYGARAQLANVGKECRSCTATWL